ncbi:hypothetical protein GQ53DRAFT_128182 [Thozetella sp. PMI_491]|nr:hypothetical protein GQ53DRAFT_128182 [Thozetella sp. PMI_491]
MLMVYFQLQKTTILTRCCSQAIPATSNPAFTESFSSPSWSSSYSESTFAVTPSTSTRSETLATLTHEIPASRRRPALKKQGYVCDRCGTTIGTKFNLNRHQKYDCKMGTAVTFNCDRGCGKKFSRKEYMRLHAASSRCRLFPHSKRERKESTPSSSTQIQQDQTNVPGLEDVAMALFNAPDFVTGVSITNFSAATQERAGMDMELCGNISLALSTPLDFNFGAMEYF